MSSFATKQGKIIQQKETFNIYESYEYVYENISLWFQFFKEIKLLVVNDIVGVYIW